MVPVSSNAPSQTMTASFLLPEEEVRLAVIRGVERYFADCRQRIPGFIDQHFHYPGAITTNRVAWGWDLLRAPLNLFWAPVYALISMAKYLLRQQAALPLSTSWLDRVPAGLTTQVQRNLEQLIRNQLLNGGQGGNLLADYISTSLEEVYLPHPQSPEIEQRFHSQLEPLIEKALQQYQVTRTASADITNSLSCTILGAFAFQKFTPGGIGIAFITASLFAKAQASRDFWLGETLGSFWYSLFPPEPTLGMTAAMLLSVMTMLSALAALSGVVIDPIQSALGLHRRRLRKMLEHLEQDFYQNTENGFRPKDQFIARIMDGIDMIRSGLS